MLIAVLDANVLFPMMLRDVLLSAAEAGCFRAHWSDRILDEVTRNLVGTYGMDALKARALRQVIEEAFPEADVHGWHTLEASMRNHPKDRHVAAVAAKIGAQVIVTSNIRDFSDLPAGTIAMTPDEFLLALLELVPDSLLSALRLQASGYRRPPMSAAELAKSLAVLVPRFSTAALARMSGSRGT